MTIPQVFFAALICSSFARCSNALFRAIGRCSPWTCRQRLAKGIVGADCATDAGRTTVHTTHYAAKVPALLDAADVEQFKQRLQATTWVSTCSDKHSRIASAATTLLHKAL